MNSPEKSPLLLYQFLENLDEGVIILNCQQNIDFINHSAKSILNIRSSKNKATLESIFKDRNFKVAELLTESSKKCQGINEHEVDFQSGARTKKLAINILSLHNTALSNRLFIIIKDITQFHKLHIKKRLLQAQLKKNYANQMENLNQLSNSVAHEMRNPLVAIGGFATRIINNFDDIIKDPDTLLKYLTYIKDDTERLNKITQLVDQYSNIEDLHFKKMDMIHQMEIIFHKLTIRAQKAGVTINLPDLPQKNYIMYIDRPKLQKALLDLATEAIKLANLDDTITIKTNFNLYEFECEIEVNTSLVTNEEVKFMFNPFYSSSRYEMNFELPSSHRIILLHGGIIKLFWQDADELVFHINIPKEKRTIPR